MINNLKFFIQIILLTPLIFLILILSPIFRVRIGRIKSNLIGHMTMPMEIFIGEKKIGLHPKNEIVLWYLQDGQITNKFLYKSLNKELLILPGIILFPLHLFFSKFRLTEKFVYYKVIETQKDRKKKILGDKQIDDNDIFINSKSYINFSKKEIEYGDNFLKKNFIEKNQKFVCFASRSKNFKDESINSLRNGSIRSQILGINYLLDNKYKAVRMGRKEQEKMKDVNNNIFDYSFSNEIDDFLDIYIISKCKFMICTQHGLNEVATAMRVPKLVVNFWFWCDLYANHLGPIIVPKKIFSIKEKKLLNYVEIFKRGLDSNSTTESLGCNYESIDNNENEILDATKEMYNLVEFNNLDLKYQFNNQLDFWNKFKNYFGYLPKNTIISPSFFKQNEDLFC